MWEVQVLNLSFPSGNQSTVSATPSWSGRATRCCPGLVALSKIQLPTPSTSKKPLTNLPKHPEASNSLNPISQPCFSPVPLAWPSAREDGELPQSSHDNGDNHFVNTYPKQRTPAEIINHARKQMKVSQH
ncbi:hypothetical protein PtA15_5A624 [Puccinia triticina]|uniref:Uncharacterized protein n=1 Tax=Puccinia triticina TaxID=208348 RepID=A0ABY7CK23_9BASI|nr:uncharacterized protein PtA15_5A624 [Puccinia triticina]WAQ85050.1 hypothetical protein PtA15_5A624 [Puccinia triticina]WAR58384.1 hypothetical protein PtB15_5B618 [Puccinia triticina]